MSWPSRPNPEDQFYSVNIYKTPRPFLSKIKSGGPQKTGLGKRKLANFGKAGSQFKVRRLGKS